MTAAAGRQGSELAPGMHGTITASLHGMIIAMPAHEALTAELHEARPQYTNSYKTHF